MRDPNQGKLAGELIFLAMVLIFVWMVNDNNTAIEWDRKDRNYSVGKVYKYYSTKGDDAVQFFYYCDGEKRLMTRYIPDAYSSSVGRFFAIRYPKNEPEKCELNIDEEIIDTAAIINGGFKLITKHRFDIATGKYVAYKEFR